jgi:hypothetical protein
MFPDRKARRNSFRVATKEWDLLSPGFQSKPWAPTGQRFQRSVLLLKYIRIQSSVDSTPEVELSDAFSVRGCSELNFSEPIPTYNCAIVRAAIRCLPWPITEKIR